MKTRLVTGFFYVLTLGAFFFLKCFFGIDLIFDALIWLFALIGTFEMLRALSALVTKAEKILVFLFAIFCIPSCALFEHFYGTGVTAVAVCFFVFAVLALTLLVSRHEETSLEGLGASFLAAVYPNLLLVLLTLANHLTATPSLTAFGFDSRLAILFVFVVSPVSDSLAYVFGRFLKKKFPKKMAPVVSPNKTVIGGIGGLVGGLLAAVVLYFSYNAAAGSFEHMALWLPVYLGIGLLAAAATELGDLVESCVKRKVGIKDMGKLLPGHGGIMDRIDGTMYTTVVVYAAFKLIYLIV